ncbi:Hypothetical predicted protein, partial [Pelobates cultripes]
ALRGVSPWLSLKPWIAHTINYISDVCSQSTFLAFPDLQSKFQLPNSLIFQYLQFKSIIHTKSSKKVIYQWYLTPQRLYQIYPAADPKCWRCGFQDGTMTHIWWECNGIKPLWKQVQAILNKAITNTQPLTPMMGLLMLFPTTWKIEDKKLASLVILAARNLLALHWKSTYCPSNKELIDKIYQYYRYEVLSSGSYERRKQTEQMWKPWLALMGHP